MKNFEKSVSEESIELIKDINSLLFLYANEVSYQDAT